MSYLTLQNLDTNRLSYYDWQVARKGQELYSKGQTVLIEFNGDTAKVHVLENSQNFAVVIKGETKTTISMQCNCTQAAKQNVCRHMVGAIFATREYIQERSESDWKYRLGIALESTPKKKKSILKGERYVFLFGLETEKAPDNSTRFRLLPFRFYLKDWNSVDMDLVEDPEQYNQLLISDLSWQKKAEVVSSAQKPFDCANLAPEAIQFYNLMFGKDFNVVYYRQVGFVEFANYLPFIAERQIPIYRVTSRGAFRERLVINNEPVIVEAAMTRVGDLIEIQSGVTIQNKLYSTSKSNLQVVSRNPDWIMAGDYLAPVENTEALDFMKFFPLYVPKEEENSFRNEFFRPLAERLPIVGDIIVWKEVHADPKPCLFLDEDKGQLVASLIFAYPEESGGQFFLESDPKAPGVYLADIPESWSMVRIHRNLDREQFFAHELTDARYGLKRAGSEYGAEVYQLRARTHPLDFLMHSIPQLVKVGFEIFGEDKIKTAKINRSIPRLHLDITSGIDWFEVNATLIYGEQEVGLNAVRKAVRHGDKYIKLADGSIGQIPEEMINRYKMLFDLASETDTGIRLNDFHLPLVDELFAGAGFEEIPVDLIERRNRLKDFEKIADQPVPTGFVGELRPYQKAGLNWLHFLREYRFGGCLADDMGLGKTIQVLAFLQSMREQGKGSAASLLIVPKSLIANWQREAEKFTPALRLHVFMGNTRKKDSQVFNQYDIILTTYGTMLRDIEFLRSYTFHYVILDESQAIKNPLAQSTKAARLLNTEFRLVMTGTPVENNTFELWSQFAFINPGLLGSMEYFKREFSQPIEIDHDENIANTLRKLIFPFILRRTKEQVAPELPPRTERIIYTDLGPAQRKAYTHTRDRFRQEILGLIESNGMNDSRMKILEGLLRLRQTCIHPVLVDPAYHGDAAKFDLLFETLETLRSEQHKVLVFSQFVETLKLVRKELDLKGYRYAYLDGQTKDRQEQVDLFQNDQGVGVFLISLKAGGVGLNLTAADYVVHLDPWWNPAVEMQASDRAHRIGQEKPVFVYKFIARDSVEEKILVLQERKKELVEQLVSQEGSFFKSITTEDVRELFS